MTDTQEKHLDHYYYKNSSTKVDVKFTTSLENGNVYKTTNMYSISEYPSNIIDTIKDRLQWKRFGEAAKNNNKQFTSLCDEVFIEITPKLNLKKTFGKEKPLIQGHEPNKIYYYNSDIDSVEMTNKTSSSKLKNSIVNCRFCGKNTHWSINCPTKVNTEKEKSEYHNNNHYNNHNNNHNNNRRNQDGYKRNDENKERHSDKPSITGLKISDLDDSLSESEIRDHFDQFGKIINLFMLKSKKTNTFNGIVFITYSTQEENDNALVDIKRKALNYLIPTVEYAKPKY